MITDWVADEDTDGHGAPLADDMLWQATLWRRLRERIGTPSPAERLPGACDLLFEQPGLIDLPARLSVFGPTRLSHTNLAVLEALAAHRDVHLWLTHPSPAMWEALRQTDPAIRRRDDHTALALANPLLASLARDVREMQQLLPAAGADIHHQPLATSAGSVFARIQDDVRHGRDPAASAQLPNDGSVAIHACHGQVRQVEVLRESLLHLFNDDPTLQPRDVIVLCPDVDTFAPLIAAAFGQTDAPHPGHRLRVRVADRGPARINPLLEILQTLLGLADGRVTASEVLDLAAAGPVARRFGFSGEDLETLRPLGLRRRRAVGDRRSNSESCSGLAVFGRTRSTPRATGSCSELTADESELAWLATRCRSTTCDAATSTLPAGSPNSSTGSTGADFACAGRNPARIWADATGRMRSICSPRSSDAEAWQRTQASRRLGEGAAHAGEREPVAVGHAGAAGRRVRPRPTRSNFRTGEITVATLVPMRFVPHRVVAIIGLDDEAFPRVASVKGDDILAVDPCLGERDPRSEDRQLLLDAVMSATDHLLHLLYRRRPSHRRATAAVGRRWPT